MTKTKDTITTPTGERAVLILTGFGKFERMALVSSLRSMMLQVARLPKIDNPTSSGQSARARKLAKFS